MFKKLLIANRGEIAARIARTCRRLGVASVALYSEADAGAPHTQLADEAFCIGPAPVGESYLCIDKLLDVASRSQADAIHPGYGLLSENSTFIKETEQAGITFVGPASKIVSLMGDKVEARRFAVRAGVPVVPGSEGALDSDADALEFAAAHGYPLLVKAAAGGGGIGMKVAKKEKALVKALAECRRRGESAFGSSKIYLERYIENPRHVEIQIIADAHGNALHLFERECSIQRRHQKVIEEAPSVLMERFPNLRADMTQAALSIVRESGYTNAGTIEFIVDSEGGFYFIEMNTRLQVEHPITEMITGLDLVELQLRVAADEPLPLTQDDIRIQGHAIECRIYAENPERQFLPSPGTIERYVEPVAAGIRVDSGVQENWRVSPYYDPMMAKVVSHAENRAEATAQLHDYLGRFVIDGMVHNIDMHRAVLGSDDFRDAQVHTGWLEEWYSQQR